MSLLCKREMQDWLIPSGPQSSGPAHSPHTPAGPILETCPATEEGGRGAAESQCSWARGGPRDFPATVPVGTVSQEGAWAPPVPTQPVPFLLWQFSSQNVISVTKAQRFSSPLLSPTCWSVEIHVGDLPTHPELLLMTGMARRKEGPQLPWRDSRKRRLGRGRGGERGQEGGWEHNGQ